MAVKLLSDMPPGESGIIQRVGGDRMTRRRIMDMGVVPGAELSVERIAPLGDPIAVRIKGYNLSLRREEASNINVEVA